MIGYCFSSCKSTLHFLLRIVLFMVEAFVPVLILLLLGAVYRQFTGVDNALRVRRSIADVVFHVFLPVLAFHVLSTAPLDTSLITVPVVSGVTTMAVLGIALLVLPRTLRLLRPSLGVLLLACAWGNVTYLGLPLVTNVYGMHLQRIPLLYDLLASTPLLFGIGTFFCVRYTEQDIGHSVFDGLKQALTSPAFLAVVAGIGCNTLGVVLPVALTKAMQLVGLVVAPIMIFAVGLALTVPRLSVVAVISPVLVLKLVVSPLIAFGLGSLVISDSEVFRATVLEAAMPTMMLPIVFAERYGMDVELLAQAILWTTLVSMITLPIVASL